PYSLRTRSSDSSILSGILVGLASAVGTHRPIPYTQTIRVGTRHWRVTRNSNREAFHGRSGSTLAFHNIGLRQENNTLISQYATILTFYTVYPRTNAVKSTGACLGSILTQWPGITAGCYSVSEVGESLCM